MVSPVPDERDTKKVKRFSHYGLAHQPVDLREGVAKAYTVVKEVSYSNLQVLNINEQYSRAFSCLKVPTNAWTCKLTSVKLILVSSANFCFHSTHLTFLIIVNMSMERHLMNV